MAELVALFIQLYSMIILARVLMSWVQIDPSSPLARTLIDLTEPVLKPIRDLMPPAAGLDFSPIIAIILLQVLGQILVQMFA
ncbi:MAG TPA: YggT family protein [Aggregatilinea sp.]|uniref:YggT family protein n=1 Tax=Aggregatilinea sp. TaxID=2806333 RepID=UPI002BC02D90|nr:YggT family protein [Aggregatilinea sp.]HML21046.1 YggT family protein [Aggregatilinea sp.]